MSYRIPTNERQVLRELSKRINTFLFIVDAIDTKTDASTDYLITLRDQILSLRHALESGIASINDLIGRLSSLASDHAQEIDSVTSSGRYSQQELLQKLQQQSSPRFLKNSQYQNILFHLSEIADELAMCRKVIQSILRKRSHSVDVLFEELHIVQCALRDHVIAHHIEDVVFFDEKQKRTIASKGLMSALSDFFMSE